MQKSPLCFDLIKSLERAEKIHFKRYLAHQSSASKPAAYVRLFDELNRMTVYDPKRLKRKFKGEKLLKNLPASLNYLYSSLLHSLVNFHTKKDDVLIADEMMSEIRILFQKRLYQQCGRHIKRARKFFEEREYSRQLYTLGSYEYNLMVIEMQQDEITELKRITQERRSYLRKLDNELLIFDLCDQLTRYDREKQLNPNRDFTIEIADITQQLRELKSGFETGSTTFKLFYTRAIERLYYIKNQPIESLHAAHRYVRLRRDLPETLRYSNGADLDAVSNHITKSIEMWFADEAAYWLPELTTICTQAKNLQYRVDLLNWHFRFQILLMRGQFDELADLVSQLMNDLDVLLTKNVAYYRILMFENLALYHFLMGNFQESLEWINRVFEQKNTDEWVRKFTINMRLIEIMAHFNLKNYQLIPSLCRSFERSAKKIQYTDNEFVQEIKWAKRMKLLENYMLPRQIKDFIKTILPEGYFAVPPNYRLVLMSVWAQAYHNNISLRESWAQHAENITTEMKVMARMETLCFEKIMMKNSASKAIPINKLNN